MFAAKLEELVNHPDRSSANSFLRNDANWELTEFVIQHSAAILALVVAVEQIDEHGVTPVNIIELQQALATLNGANDEA